MGGAIRAPDGANNNDNNNYTTNNSNDNENNNYTSNNIKSNLYEGVSDAVSSFGTELLASQVVVLIWNNPWGRGYNRTSVPI